MEAIIKAHDGKVQMIDSSVVRLHQQAAAQKNKRETLVSVEVVEAPGQTNDAPMAEILLNDLPVGAAVIADKGYKRKQFRHVATRFGRNALNYLAMMAALRGRLSN